MTVLLVALGAAAGAPLRYVTDRFIQSRVDAVFPWGTLGVNVVGSFVVGVVTAASVEGRLNEDMVALIAVGFCGALTTYSTFSYETLRLFEDGARWYAFGNVVVSILAGVAAASAGWALAS
ncbi:fluoride efflux transporter CrcB [Phytoactinopolyspora endophytica]|uniref:fluoride efflux transporter CrcB n=1 Tax=Phytoactinopolyspora endophytica TaxID=1642495 RepID=UPI00101C4477|nr:fluoride efflux transporter CrcB [Phytoactinopolyspora endophytica]